MKKTFIYITSLIVVLSVFGFSSGKNRVVVKSSVANVRTLPGMDGKIVMRVKKGDVFTVAGESGKWYKIYLPKKSKSKYGYIHHSLVELVMDSSVGKKDLKKKKIKKAKKHKIRNQKRRTNYSGDKLFSGFYLKGGLMTSPKAEDFGNKWIISLGFDNAIGKYLAWGLELQPYLRSLNDPAIDLSINDFVSNIYLNVKGGINMGRLIRSLGFLTLYTGGGAGLNLDYSSVSLQNIKGNQFDLNFSWHLMFGSEISIGKADLIIEFQSNKVIYKDIDPSSQTYNYLFIGVRF